MDLLSVDRLAAALVLFCTASFLSANVKAQNCDLPAVPDATVTTTQDRDQMLCQLGIKLPTLPSRATDPHRPANTFPENPDNPEGTYTDAIGGNTVERTDFGLWNGYIDQSGLGAINLGGINPGYTPIDLLRTHEGRRIHTAKQWWIERRPEVLHDTQVELYGVRPPDEVLPKVTGWTVTETTGVGTQAPIAYKERDIVGAIDVSGYPPIRNVPKLVAFVRTPAAATGPVPMIIIFAPFGGSTFFDQFFLERYWATIAPSAYGVTIFDGTYLQPDSGGANMSSYFLGLLSKGNWRKPTDMGELGALAWGVSRVIDYLETDADVDANKIGLSGHSRWGKATLVAAAYDQRVTVSYPSCAGSLGTKMQRRMWGQTIENSEWDQEYQWMAGNFMRFMGPLRPNELALRKYENLKVDAHSMVALVAPRPIFINGGTNASISDTWQDAQGMYLTTQAATPVYKLLGEEGVIIPPGTQFTTGEGEAPGGTPPINQAFIEGNIGYRRHAEGHTDAPDWPSFLQFASRYFSDDAPVIAPGQAFTVSWNEHIGKIQASSGHDLQNWQVVGGDAAAFLDVDRRTGEIRFAPDGELFVRSRHPIGHDGGFSLIVTVSDGINTSRAVEVKIAPP
jgi:hypothetical protein